MIGAGSRNSPFSHFSLAMLAVIEELGVEAWGSNIKPYLSKRLDKDVGIDQIYSGLTRLCVINAVSFISTPSVIKGNKRNIYTLTPLGRRALKSVSIA